MPVIGSSIGGTEGTYLKVGRGHHYRCNDQYAVPGRRKQHALRNLPHLRAIRVFHLSHLSQHDKH
eukprot:scaffold224295_cov55-Attheya_sp.AAC.1